jgi:hypothetical protein
MLPLGQSNALANQNQNQNHIQISKMLTHL